MTDATKKCFVLSPIGKDGSPERDVADKVLKHIIRKALPDFRVLRADDDQNPGDITPQIVARILEADLIVADLSGQNPNVFYEMAIAHGYKKPTVHIRREGDTIPFDVKDIRTQSYDITDPDSIEIAVAKLGEMAKYALANAEKVSTPLSSAQRFAAVEASDDPVAQSNVQVIEAIDELRREVRLLRLPRGRTSQGEAGRADQTALMAIIERIVGNDRAVESDFYSTVNNDTSPAFDLWARQRLSALAGTDDDSLLDSLLMDPSMFDN
jgi:hypothetical protein